MAGVRWLILTVAVSGWWIQLMLGTTCQGGRFGDTCSYSCHCTPHCNQTTGVCNGACDPGWFGGNGQTCQRGNVAYNKTAASTPPTNYAKPYGWTADKAVDGNRDQHMLGNSCFHSHSDVRKAVWTVDLRQQYRIHDVRIYNRVNNPHLIRTAVLSLSNSSSSTPGVTCYTFPSDTDKTNNSVYDVTCDGTGRYFTITHNTALNLCEVEIYVCPKGSYGQTCNNSCTVRKCAVDSPCDHIRGTCVSGCAPGWRGEDCLEVCSNDSYGRNCNNSCTVRKCAGDSPCDHIRGTCVSGCAPGWRGGDCLEVCSNDSYGRNCNNSCTVRKCAGDSPCDHIRGTCVSGCAPGWRGEDCFRVCSNDSYGRNCNNSCTVRKCAGDSPCDHIRGTCVSGCAPGWRGEDCFRVCPNGSYGQNCSNSCTDRKCAGDSPCDHVKGTCVSGCEPGWMGEDCREEDVRSVQAAGYNASQLAVAVAVAFVAGAVLGVIVSVIVWRRRKRCQHKTSESHPTNVSTAQTERSQASNDVRPGTRTYDSLNAVSYDAKMKTDTYCTIKSGKADLGTDVTALTSCDVSDSNGARTYETLDNTSRGTDGEYSEIGKLK